MITVAKLGTFALGVVAAGLLGGIGTGAAHADMCFNGTDVSTPDHLNAGLACHKDPGNVAYDAVKDKNQLTAPKGYVLSNGVLIWSDDHDWPSLEGHTH